MTVDLDIVLYHAPGSRSQRVKMLLKLLGYAYREVRMDLAADDHKSPEYLSINPLGTVPGLTVGGTPIAESVAQMLYLADSDPERCFAPEDTDPRRLKYLEWMVMVPASLEPSARAFFADPSDASSRASLMEGVALQSEMLVGPYCLGDRMTALDVLIHWNSTHMERLGLFSEFPKWQDYMRHMRDKLDWDKLELTT